MKQKINKNIRLIQEQIDNSLELLLELKLAKFYMPTKIDEDSENSIVRISWDNHVGGREVSSNAFLKLEQYFTILESASYHALMFDYSIIRVSFTFQFNKLISQNLLWWPCPVKIENEFEEFSPIEVVQLHLEDIQTIRMRSPIRIDFDISKDTDDIILEHISILNIRSQE